MYMYQQFSIVIQIDIVSEIFSMGIQLRSIGGSKLTSVQILFTSNRNCTF